MTLRRRRRNIRGFTIIELFMTITIITIIASIGAANYGSLQARLRFSKVKADMDAIAKAAYSDYTASPTNDWAVMVMPGAPPSFASTTLVRWPEPPCPGWIYSWDNFYGAPGVQAVRITVRRPDLSSIWSYCLQSYGGNCEGDDGFGGTPPNITALQSKYVHCAE